MEASLRHLGVVAAMPGPSPLARKTPSSSREQSAQPPAPVANGSQSPVGPKERHVPDLLGRSARSALVVASQADLLLTLQGSGVVVAQKPSAGQTVHMGASIEVTLAPQLPGSSAPVPGVAEQRQTKTPASGTRAQAPLVRPVAEGRDG
jgi:hypothetical protein